MAHPQVKIDVDKHTGTWRVDGMPMILVPQHFFLNNHKAMESALGRSVYCKYLQDSGYRSAYDWCAAEAARHELQGTDVFHHYMVRLSQRGWGRFEVLHLDIQSGEAEIQVENSVFVRPSATEEHASSCYMFSAWLVGSLEYVGRTLDCHQALHAHEVFCATDAQHDRCLFRVTPAISPEGAWADHNRDRETLK